MRIRLHSLRVTTKRTTETIAFSSAVTFIHGPVSTGKSTVARLVDYCMGGDLEWTPAVQQEFVAAELSVSLGEYRCRIERSAEDGSSLRVSWEGPKGDIGSVNAPLQAQGAALLNADVYNFSDLVFHLCGVTPIKVRKRSRDPESPLIRLSIRDIWQYCYLDQTHLDSSFFRLEHPFRARKSQDAMRFFTGLHSERMSQLETSLLTAIDEQRSKREAVKQIRQFMSRFELGSELELAGQRQTVMNELAAAEERREELERLRAAQIHPTDTLRTELRRLSQTLEELRVALSDIKKAIAEQEALRAELITAKVKAERADRAKVVLEGAHYERCPQCGSVLDEDVDECTCPLCGKPQNGPEPSNSVESEALRRDLNNRIDEIADSLRRRSEASARLEREVRQIEKEKADADDRLQRELRRYDSAFIESVRGVEREIATLRERLKNLERLRLMPEAIDRLEEEAGALQGSIDRFRGNLEQERTRLRAADENILAVADRFKQVMLSVGFPGVTESDTVTIDPRNWAPEIVHGEQRWGFWDTGSGGKKTLFNVCFALALHAVGRERGLPLPALLIVDSPTKNISEDVNPDLVRSLYEEIYLQARDTNDQMQFLLIDSDLVEPTEAISGFSGRRMAGEPDAPSLIPYYVGP